MSTIIQGYARHLFAALAAYLAAHGVDALPNTHSLVLGLCILGVVSVWSWIAKLLKLDPSMLNLTRSEALRTALGSIISQGITFASTYYAVDVNDPAALSAAVLNAVASHYGVHQQIAHQTPLVVATAIKALALCSLLSLSSCTTTAAFLSSPFGQATLQTADQLAKQVLVTTETLGLQQIIIQASAKFAVLKAQAPERDVSKEALRIGQITGYAGVIEAAQVKYAQLTGKRFTMPKNPMVVIP